jgi:3-dehydroquinate dehydratase/shikimate dehydrogenase
MPDTVPQVCAVITEETVEAARSAIRLAADVADLIELRLDYLQDFDFGDLNALISLIEDKPLPVIITCRSVAEGGRQRVDDQLRLRLLVEGARQAADYCDIEAAHYSQTSALSPDHSRLIISLSPSDETPGDLGSVYDRVASLPAAVHKIVTRASAITDTLALFSLLEERVAWKATHCDAMGQAGVITRVLGPSAAVFSYLPGSLNSGKSADGQLT